MAKTQLKQLSKIDYARIVFQKLDRARTACASSLRRWVVGAGIKRGNLKRLANDLHEPDLDPSPDEIEAVLNKWTREDRNVAQRWLLLTLVLLVQFTGLVVILLPAPPWAVIVAVIPLLIIAYHAANVSADAPRPLDTERCTRFVIGGFGEFGYFALGDFEHWVIRTGAQGLVYAKGSSAPAWTGLTLGYDWVVERVTDHEALASPYPGAAEGAIQTRVYDAPEVGVVVTSHFRHLDGLRRAPRTARGGGSSSPRHRVCCGFSHNRFHAGHARRTRSVRLSLRVRHTGCKKRHT